MKPTVAVLPGDGIGPEVIGDARRALELIDEIYRQGGGVLEPGKTAAAW